MSEVSEVAEEIKEEKKAKKGWFGWVNSAISAVVGAVLSFGVTIGVVSRDSADKTSAKVDSWLGQAETVTVKVASAKEALEKARQLIKDNKYIDAVAALNEVYKDMSEAVSVADGLVKEFKEAKEAAKEAKEAVSEKAAEAADAAKPVAGQLEEKAAEPAK